MVCLSMLGILACCSASSPTHYYTLQAIVPTAAPPSPMQEPVEQAPLRLEPVVIPPELDRLELVIRSGRYRLRIEDSERWAAPLDDQIRRVLSDDLAQRLPPHALVDFNEPANSQPRRLLIVAVGEFYADESCAVSLHVDWTLKTPGGNIDRGNLQVQQPASSPCAADAIPAAMSTALGSLTDRLVHSISTAVPAAGS
jgi:hypothetical protein